MDISIPSKILEYLLSINSLNLSNDLNKYLVYWPVFLLGIVISFILTPIIGDIAVKCGMVYKPGEKRLGRDYDNEEKALHKKDTPGLGGLAITIPVLIALLIFFKLDSLTIPILISFLILAIGSTLDDLYNLPGNVQLGYQLLASIIIAISIIDFSSISIFGNDIINLSFTNISFSILSLPMSLSLPGDIFLVIWLILCINSVKWVGGSPGLVESYSFVIFTMIFLIGVRTFSPFSSTMSILISGCLISLLYFAFPEPKIMSGSSGKSTYGFLIAILALISSAKISTTIILLSIPILDATYVLIGRYLKYKPKNPFDLLKINDTTHLHHQLLKMDLSNRQVLLIETAITLLISSIAILTTGANLYFAFIFTLALVIGLIVFVNLKAKKKVEDKKESPESKYSY